MVTYSKPPNAYSRIMEGTLAARQRRETSTPVKPNTYMRHKLDELSAACPSKALQFIKESNMDYSNRYELGHTINVSESGMAVRGAMSLDSLDQGPSAPTEAQSARAHQRTPLDMRSELWKSPLDSLSAPPPPKTADTRRLEHIMRPYTSYRLEHNSKTVVSGHSDGTTAPKMRYFYTRGVPTDNEQWPPTTSQHVATPTASRFDAAAEGWAGYKLLEAEHRQFAQSTASLDAAKAEAKAVDTKIGFQYTVPTETTRSLDRPSFDPRTVGPTIPAPKRLFAGGLF